MPAARFVYVGQYDRLWKLTRAQWVACCQSGARGEGYVLPGRPLRRAPAFIYRTRELYPGEDRYPNAFGVAGRSDVVLIEPLDWAEDDFRAWLADNGA